MISYKIYLL